jgi:hypothetical protein
MSFLGQLENIGSRALNVGTEQIANAVLTVGKSAVHTIIPDEYEYYLCSLELFDSTHTKTGYISFVVMPDQISESHSPIQNIVKTHGGIVTVINPTFAPVDISLAGTFGRKWRLASNYKDPTKNKSGFLSLNFGKLLNMSLGVKSGYGLTKVLEKILKTANSLDSSGKPYTLVFNNYAFNTAYVVNVMNFSFSQSSEQNMMWAYSMSLRAVGYKPIYTKETAGSFLGKVASNAIAGGLTKLCTSMIGYGNI